MRVLDILELLGEYPSGLTLAEISKKIELPKSSTHRILGVLLDRQYIRESYSNGKYLLGYQILGLSKACLSSIDLLHVAHPYMKSLIEEFNETVIIGALDHNCKRIIYLDKIDSSHSLRLVSSIGERVPVHCTALGKAILSKFNVEKICAILNGCELSKFTEHTIVDIDDLLAELQNINQIGFAVDHEEYKSYVSCVAAPICGFEGIPVAAISMSVPTSRFSDERSQLIIKKIMESASAIEKIISLIR